MPSTSGVIDRLRAATKDLHAENMRLPYFTHMLKGRLRRECYVTHLRALAVVHAVLERGLAQADHPLVRQVWEPSRARLPLLHQDLLHFRRSLIPDVGRAMEKALEIAAEIRLQAMEDPAALLGHLYVLEGSTQGARILHPHVAKALEADAGHGLAYLVGDGDRAGERWQRFVDRMNRVVTRNEDKERVAEAAAKLFEDLLVLFAALEPHEEKDLGFRAVSLNPEAGNHPVPAEPDVLNAVLRASERTLAEHPYFVSRYGARGWFFSDSDGAWLTALTGLGFEAMSSQVDWLAGVLASRGMPRMLLIRHLEVLGEEIGTLQNRPEEQDLLHRAAARLESRVHARMPRDEATDLARFFAAEAGQEGDSLAREVGLLIAWAVADEADGLAGAVESLLHWAAAPKRFPESWVGAVRSLTEKARGTVRENQAGLDGEGA